jgi:acyl-CoA thioester hydrolase
VTAREPFTREVHVRFNDCDGMRHVNNAVYLSYVEDARIAFFMALGEGRETSFIGRGLIVARCEVDYVKPVLFGHGPVEASVDVQHIGRSSFRLGYLLRQEGAEVARAATVIVGYDYKTARSRALHDVEREALEAYLVAPESDRIGEVSAHGSR